MNTSSESREVRAFSFEDAMVAFLPGAALQVLPGDQRQHPQAQWLMGIKPYTDDRSVHSQYWERHPCGDELLALLEGRLRLTLQANGQEVEQDVLAGQSVLIPRGCWHRLQALEPGRVMFVTPTANSEHRRVDARQDALSGRRRHVALGFDVGVFEQEAFHLLRQVFAGADVGQVEPVFVDQACLGFDPLGPGLLRDVLPDADAQFAGIGRRLEAFGFLLEFYTVDHACHDVST